MGPSSGSTGVAPKVTTPGPPSDDPGGAGQAPQRPGGSPGAGVAPVSHRVAGLLQSLVVGAITGVMAVVIAGSCAALIFSGPLADRVSVGLAGALFCTVVVGVVGAFASSYAGTVATVQTEPAAILALMATSIVAALPADAGRDAAYGTVLAAMIVAAGLTGLVLTILGIFRLGAFIRFIPYPVIGGFMAGIGWLLFTGSITVMTGIEVVRGSVPRLMGADAVAHWLPGLVLALAMLVAQRRLPRAPVMPVLLLASMAIFYAVLLGAGMTMREATAGGWVLGDLPRVSIAELTGSGVLADAHWGVILAHSGSLGAVVLISLLSLLLNASALELAAEEDLDLDRELRETGMANLVGALGGGMIGYHSLSLSRLSLKMGARTRVVGVVTAAVCAVTLSAGTMILSAFPKPVLGGLLMFLGLSFLVEWVYDARSRLPAGDYVVVLLILLTVGSVGYLEGLALGILAAIILFVVRYSRISLVKQAVSGSVQRSNVDRPWSQVQQLREQGEHTFILKLQGFIFFGSANGLLNQIRDRVMDLTRAPLSCVVFDFRRVSGLDTSAAISFTKIRQLAERLQFTVALSSITPELERQLAGWGVGREASDSVRWFPDLDHALEWSEDQLLGAALADAPPPGGGPAWDAALPPPLRERLGRYLERLEIPADSELIRQGEPADALYFIESGQLSVQLTTMDGRTIRLRKIGPGSVLGEVGLYTAGTRSASVVADRPSVAHRLAREALDAMHADEPDVASAFHEHMARLLAERVVHTNKILETVLD